MKFFFKLRIGSALQPPDPDSSGTHCGLEKHWLIRRFLMLNSLSPVMQSCPPPLSAATAPGLPNSASALKGQ